ncbi:hypothetical protein SUGI_0989870 [Cryptomeria japonica]|nr:hypothetical protein SUGI_0989870 [Cryptomeria japonica]
MEGEFICGAEGEEETEQRALSELPRHIKKCIFEQLSLQSISRSRLVCREWNSILSSRSFVKSLPKYNPWLLLCAQNMKYCMAYCFSTHKWRKISFPFLPTPIRKNLSNYIFSSAELGLLLLKSPDLYVCDPLTKLYAKIEIDMVGTVIGIVQGENGESYLVAKMGYFYEFEKFPLRIYHYYQNSWRIKFEFSEKRHCLINPYTIVACNGVLFFGAQCPIIVGYNIRDASIRPVRIAALPRHIVEAALGIPICVYGLSVLLVVMVKDQLKGLTLIILEFFQDDKDELLWQWREFATMPLTSLPHYFKRGYRECVVVGDYLCFISPKGTFIEGAAYNLKDGMWQCLPQCAGIEYPMILSFQPKLMVTGWQSSFCANFH